MNLVCKLLLPVVLSTAGCVSVTSYPQEWPRAETAIGGKCPDISGTYSVVSEPRPYKDASGVSHSSTISLSAILVNRKISDTSKSGVVTIKQGQDKLDVFSTEYLPKKVFDTWRKVEEGFQVQNGIDYSCTSNGVHLTPREEFSAGGFMIGGLFSWTKWEITLIKSVDGSLVANTLVQNRL